MHRRRFYALPDNIDGALVVLSREETHHLTHVLRMKPSDEAFVFDGRGREYRCSFLKVADNRAQLEVTDELRAAVESPLHLTLGQSLAKREKFDFIVQKATELGVSSIVPLATDHADVKLANERSEKRTERWRRISLEALKQCGRRKLVEIRNPVSVAEFLDQEVPNSSKSAQLVFFNEKGAALIDALAGIPDASAITALIGPEGGWSDNELRLFEERGLKSVTLGPRVLRTETAAIVAIALIQHALGDSSS